MIITKGKAIVRGLTCSSCGNLIHIGDDVVFAVRRPKSKRSKTYCVPCASKKYDLEVD